MSIEIQISERSREYGYVFWDKKSDELVDKFLDQKEVVEVWFKNSYLGKKKIDRKYRRISIGYRNTRALPLQYTKFILEIDQSGALKISCK